MNCAGRGVRAVEGIIDVVIIFGSELIGMVISTPCFVVTEALFGATITTFLLRLRVVKADGSPDRVGQTRLSATRSASSMVSPSINRVYCGLRVGKAAAGRRRGGRYFASAAVSRRPATAPAKLVLAEGA